MCSRETCADLSRTPLECTCISKRGGAFSTYYPYPATPHDLRVADFIVRTDFALTFHIIKSIGTTNDKLINDAGSNDKIIVFQEAPEIN